MRTKVPDLRSLAGTAAPTALPLLFFALFFLYPLGSVLTAGLTDEAGRFSLARFAGILARPSTLRILGFTLLQAVLSTLLALALGLPGAYLLAKTRFRGKGVLRALTTVPFVLPAILVVLGFVRFFGNNGVLNRLLAKLFSLEEPPLRILYSLKAILLAHAFYNFPVCIRIVGSVWSRIDPRTEEAARSLGARGLRLFRRVTLPQILPGILAGAALIFVLCFMSFVIILVLGGGPRYTTLEVEIYRQAKVNLDLHTAGSLAILGSCVSLLLLYLYIKLQQRTSFAESVQREEIPLMRLLKGWSGFLILMYLLLVVLVILAPMLSVLHASFTQRRGWAGESSYTLRWYARILLGAGGSGGGGAAGSAAGGANAVGGVAYIRALLNSLFYALMTVVLSVPMGTALAHFTARRDFSGRHAAESLFMLPLGISAVILGLGYLKAFRRFPIHGRWWAIVLAHTVIATPFVIRSISAVIRKIQPDLREAARGLGAGPWKLFRHVELPLLKPGLVTAAAFAFAISLGEVTATLMLTRAETITIPIAIYRLIGSYQLEAACAMGSVLMLASAGAFLVIDRIGEEAW